MGQGYSSTSLPAGPSAMETPELSDLSFEKALGAARLLRSVRARHADGVVVVKVCSKANAGVSFSAHAKLLRAERSRLRDIPNVLPYARVRETSALGLLVRPYVHASLYDRVSMRPFLEEVERKWIAFQLLCAVRDCHERAVYHGDIKSENVLVTSWAWVYLTDFAAAFKPVYLPEDNPADFSFYYDTSARRTCYLAPERFLAAAAADRPREAAVQWNMDIFSLGCVLAELFTEAPTFTLTQLFRYRKGEYDPTLPLLSKVADGHLRAMISSMIKLDPSERCHAGDYLEQYKGKAFPLYFYNHLHTLMAELADPRAGRKPATASHANSGEADDRINRIYDDFEMLSVSLAYPRHPSPRDNAPTRPPHLQSLFPLQLDLPNSRHVAHASHSSTSDNGTFILLNVITASMRSSARATSKVRACELMLAFAEQLPDEAKLDRILPYVMPLLEDPNPMVLVAALRTMTQLLALVSVVSPINSSLFAQYIFPRLQNFVQSKAFAQHAIVRATYAACLASLAETAARFLDVMQALKADGSLPGADGDVEGGIDHYDQDTYDAARRDMLDQFEGQTKVFLTDTDNAVRRAFLTSVSSLCVFFGEARASDVILSHLNTYLNDPDWLLKCAFFKTVVGIAAYIGAAGLEEFLLPLMLQALSDPQEFVVEQALRSLAATAEMGLLQRATTWELIDTIARFQMHPNIWIKEAASHFISAATTYLSLADVRILVAPLIQPYLKVPVTTRDESELLDALKKPLPRTVLDLASQWAARVDRSVFWKTAKDFRQLSYNATGHMPPQSSVADLGPRSLAKVPKTDEDEQWLRRLRNAGMRTEDEMKLLAFREYIWRSAQRAHRDKTHEKEEPYDQIVSLSQLQIQPQTVLFDNIEVSAYEQRVDRQDRTIAEAIEEASTADGKRKVPASSIGSHSVDPSGAEGAAGRNLPTPQAIRRLSGIRPNDSGSLSSSPSSAIGLLGRDVDHALRQKAHAAGLLGGAGLRGKARAAVATEVVTAEGRLDRPTSGSRKPSPVPASGEQRRGVEQAIGQRAIHNYTGNDPTVLKLLDAVYVDNFPIDAADFGPFVQPVTGPTPTNINQPPTGPWRPHGHLVAVLGEHTARVGRIVVSPDHVFFLTASDDGTIKIWDTSRLERNVAHRSRQTYSLPHGVTVTSLCFVDSTHAFVCTGSDGTVHAVKVTVTATDKTYRYGKMHRIREWRIPSTSPGVEYAVWTEHFRGETASTLVLATNGGRIMALDLRDMSVLFELRNPPRHGTPTSFCMSRRHDWLLVGTSHGVLDLWDMRFHVRVRSWTFANPAPISRVQLHPRKKSSKRNQFCITGGTAPGEMSVWDAEKGFCHEIVRPHRAHSQERLHPQDYELRNVDDDGSGSLLGRVGDVDQSHPPRNSTVSVFGVRPSTKDPEAQHPFAISGGPDGKVRFWDTERLEGCRLVNGGAPGERPAYAFTQLSVDVRVLSEKSAEPSEEAGAKHGVGESHKVSGSSWPAKRAGGASDGKPATSRYETIRTSAQNLLGGHLDVITDVAVLERPFGMVLSADRSGQILVYQ